MNNFESKNIFIANLLIILSLFILIFFSKGFYTDYKIAKEWRISEEKTLENTERTLSTYKNVEAEINEDKEDELKKYLVKYSDGETMAFIHRTADEVKNLKIENLKLEEGVKNKYGFHEGRVYVAFSYENEDELLSFISKLTTSKEFAVYINEISYPLLYNQADTKEAQIKKVNLPMTIYYK